MVGDGFFRSSLYLPILAFVIFVAVVGIAPRADAHVTGLSWIATSTPYVIDIGYDPNEFQAGLGARFDFLLRSEKTGDRASYDHVWVRLINGETTVLATGIRQQQLGPTTLLYTFTDPGDYKIETSFRDIEGNDLAVSSFPISISSGRLGGSLVSEALIFLAGACVGIFGLFMWVRRRINQ